MGEAIARAAARQALRMRLPVEEDDADVADAIQQLDGDLGMPRRELGQLAHLFRLGHGGLLIWWG
ncbi:hypothetical protein D3C86_1450440 [compost metagenome]